MTKKKNEKKAHPSAAHAVSSKIIACFCASCIRDDAPTTPTQQTNRYDGWAPS